MFNPAKFWLRPPKTSAGALVASLVLLALTGALLFLLVLGQPIELLLLWLALLLCVLVVIYRLFARLPKGR